MKKTNSLFQFSLLFIQPIFMTSNIAIARGAFENIPPVALACSRWLLVFLVFFHGAPWLVVLVHTDFEFLVVGFSLHSGVDEQLELRSVFGHRIVLLCPMGRIGNQCQVLCL